MAYVTRCVILLRMESQRDAEWLTPQAASQLLPRVSPRTVQRWAKDGRIDAIALPNGRWRIRREVVEALLTDEARR